MTRRESRESAFRIVFEMEINPMDAEEALELAEETGEPETDLFAQNLVRAVYKYRLEIDESFKPYLKGWSLSRISKASLAILRISCAQLTYWDEITENKRPEDDEKSANIIINEAVELSKKYGGDDDYSFVNGILGSLVRGEESDLK